MSHAHAHAHAHAHVTCHMCETSHVHAHVHVHEHVAMHAARLGIVVSISRRGIQRLRHDLKVLSARGVVASGDKGQLPNCPLAASVHRKGAARVS